LSYQVIARKWRPKSFSELVGQEHVSQTLLNALRNDRLHHALLFTGPRGTGKTSSARILAKSLRCPNAVDFVPCHICDICQEIAQSRSIDVIEIDGASNNGVDAIRELRDTVGYMPSSGSKKVYIIDEVHMLSTSAFNALLKTLEEPPSHVLFIMATTEAQKIPQTILSRCQRYDFRRISTREITERLGLICESDQIQFEDEALWTLARQGDGSMRDAQSLLDQAIAFTQGALTNANVAKVLGLTERILLLETLQAVVIRSSFDILKIIERFSISGIEPYLFIKDFIEALRNLLLAKISEERVIGLLEMPDSEYDFLRELASKVSEEEIHLLFDMALKGGADVHRAADSRVVLEVVLLRMASAPKVTSLQDLVYQLSRGDGGGGIGSSLSGSGAHSRSASGVGSISTALITGMMPIPTARAGASQQGAGSPGHERLAESKQMRVVPAPLEKMRAVIEKRELAPIASKEPLPRTSPAQSTADEWMSFVDTVRHDDALFAAKVENLLFIKKVEEQKMIYLAIPPRMAFLEKQMLDQNIRKRLQGYIDSYWGSGYSFQVTGSEAVGAGESAVSLTQKKQLQADEDLRNQIKQNPLVQKASEIFRGEIKAILPLEEK